MKTHNANTYCLMLLAGLALAPALASAQTAADQNTNPNRIVVPLSHPSEPARIKLQTISGSITVRGYNGNQVIVEASAGGIRHTEPPDEARGMRRLSQPMGVTADEDNNSVTINTGLRSGSVSLQIPASSDVSIKTLNGNVQVQGVSGELELEATNGVITLDQVGGSIVAHALNSAITANMVRVDPGKPSSFSTLNGRIDVTLPASVRANLNMRTDHGDIYLDQGFDFKPLASSPDSGANSDFGHNHMYRLRADDTIHGTLGGGGVEINLRTFNGSILIHKGK